jgi:hypothetical protein
MESSRSRDRYLGLLSQRAHTFHDSLKHDEAAGSLRVFSMPRGVTTKTVHVGPRSVLTKATARKPAAITPKYARHHQEVVFGPRWWRW